MNKITVALVLGILVLGGGSFYIGMKYAQNKSSAMRGQFTGGNFNGGQRAARSGGSLPGGGQGFTAGEIISKDDKSIIIKLQDGGSKIIFLTGATPVVKSVSGSFQDLSIGEQVTVTGAANQDGSISAKSIQIRP